MSGWRAALDALDERRAARGVAVLALLAGIATMTPHLIGVFFDDAIYALQAKALAEGQGFVYSQLPGAPPAIHYPPLWPLLLAAVWRVAPAFPANVAWLKMVNPLLLALAGLLLVPLGTRVFGLRPWAAAAVAALAMVSVPVLLLGNVLMSEPLFLVAFVGTLLLVWRWQQRDDAASLLLLALGTAALLLVRTIGGVLAVAVVLTLLAERRWRDVAVYVGVVAIALAPWQWFVWRHSAGFPDLLRGSYGPYLEWVAGGYRDGGLAFLGGVLAKNVGDAWRSTGAMLTPWLPGIPRQVATLALLALLAVGLVQGLRERTRRAAALAVGGYLVVILAWPFQVERFLWALWPLVALFVWSGAAALASWAAPSPSPRPRALRLAPIALAGLLGLGHLAYNLRGLARGWTSSAAARMSSRAEGLVQYINADPRLAGRTIGTEADPVVALYTGHRVVPLEVLRPVDHLVEKPLAERAREVAAFDAAFRPDAYVLLRDGVHLPALLAARLDSTRALVEITPPGVPVRSFLVLPR